MKESIGFVGVGHMGHGMAKNIVEAGYPLTVIGHRNRAPVDDLIARGAKEAKTAADLAAASDVVFLCLPGSPQVEAIVLEENGLAAGLRKGSVIVDCSTSDPVSTIALGERLAPLGIDFADVPLSRTPKEAWEGTLDAFAGATDAVFERIRPVIDTWAGRVVHVGGPGDGHRIKLLNNFVSLGYAALYAEAYALAAKTGIAPETLDSVIDGGRMDCGFYQTFRGYLIEGNREAHRFTLANALKDLRYVESMADAAGLVNPLGNAAKNSFAMAIASGADGPEDYVPMLVDHVARLNGLEPKPK